jgi:hypothetical protein
LNGNHRLKSTGRPKVEQIDQNGDATAKSKGIFWNFALLIGSRYPPRKGQSIVAGKRKDLECTGCVAGPNALEDHCADISLSALRERQHQGLSEVA